MSKTTEKENDSVSEDDIDPMLEQDGETIPETPSEKELPEDVEKDDGDDASTADAEPPAVEADDGGDDASTADADPPQDLDLLFEKEAGPEQSVSDETTDRVILEEVKREQSKKPSKEKIRWAPQKPFWIVIGMVCVFGVAINGLLWIRNRSLVDAGKPVVLSFPVTQTPVVSPAETFLTSPRSVLLKSFIVTAPLKRKDITYVTADISLELTTERAVDLIKDHAPFYRNIIYDVIHNALKALDKSKISDIGLKIAILKTLNGAVPERSVKDVIVHAFVMF